MRCKECKTKFIPTYFLQKTCSKECKYEYEKTEPKRTIKKVSDKRKTQEATYKLISKAFKLENPFCNVCGNLASDIHHKNGREGDRLNDTRFFMSICRDCHTWLHEHPKVSRENGWLM